MQLKFAKEKAMFPKNFLTTALVAAFVVAIVHSGPTIAQERERTSEGFDKDPTCSYDFSIKRSLSKLGEKEPTGIKASNNKWDMEIYANATGKSWTLVGKSKDPSAAQDELCKLASSIDKPYAQEKWYAAYFK